VLLLDDSQAVVVRGANHVGNLHWRVRFEGEILFVAIEGRSENYAARLREPICSRPVGMGVIGEDVRVGPVS
jgi:urease accessory protein